MSGLHDTYLKIAEKFFTGWRPNEIIQAALAVAERRHSSDKELITTVTLGYEIIGRFIDSIIVRPFWNRALHMAAPAGFLVPRYVGKLLGFSEE